MKYVCCTELLNGCIIHLSRLFILHYFSVNFIHYIMTRNFNVSFCISCASGVLFGFGVVSFPKSSESKNLQEFFLLV